jgi:NitT/TauT family transport system substrate-binding protein
LTTTQKYIDEHPDIVQKVVNALERAMRFAYTDFTGAVEVGQKAFPDLPKNVIEMAVKRMIDDKTLPEHIAVDSEGWQKALGVCKDVGKLKKNYPTEQFVDNSFANKAMGTH